MIRREGAGKDAVFPPVAVPLFIRNGAGTPVPAHAVFPG